MTDSDEEQLNATMATMKVNLSDIKKTLNSSSLLSEAQADITTLDQVRLNVTLAQTLNDLHAIFVNLCNKGDRGAIYNNDDDDDDGGDNDDDAAAKLLLSSGDASNDNDDDGDDNARRGNKRSHKIFAERKRIREYFRKALAAEERYKREHDLITKKLALERKKRAFKEELAQKEQKKKRVAPATVKN